MIEFLVSQGFRAYKSCNCEGGKVWLKKAEMAGIEVILLKRGDQYEIKRSGNVINRGQAFQLQTEYFKLFT